MAFHSPGHENQSKNGSNPYAKGDAASTTNKAGAQQAPKPGQKPNKGKKAKNGAKGPKQTPAQAKNQQPAGQAKGQKAQQQSGAQKPGGVQATQKQGAKGAGAPAAKKAGDAKGDNKVAVVRKKGLGGGARDGRVYEERSVMHVDPMSALKVGFLLSACLFLVWVVAALVIYMGLELAGVWDRLNGLIGDLTGSGEFGFGAYFGIVFALGLMELVVLTLLAPVAAMAYNASAALIGGLRIKLDN